MTSTRVRLSVADARDLAEGALRGIGYHDDEARIIADHVIDAALCGYEYSGLAKILNVPGERALPVAAPTHEGAARDRGLARLRRRQQCRHAGALSRGAGDDRESRRPRHCARFGDRRLDERAQRLLCRDDRQSRPRRDPHRGQLAAGGPARRHPADARHQSDRDCGSVVARTDRARHGHLGLHDDRGDAARAAWRVASRRRRARARRRADQGSGGWHDAAPCCRSAATKVSGWR